MLARIGEFVAEREASQEATRRFFADASHELRTPLGLARLDRHPGQEREPVDAAPGGTAEATLSEPHGLRITLTLPPSASSARTPGPEMASPG